MVWEVEFSSVGEALKKASHFVHCLLSSSFKVTLGDPERGW